MQVAAMRPIGLDESNIPDDVRERELQIARDKAIQDNKPEHIIEKIAEGSLKKFYKENTLIHQSFVKDPSLTVAQYVQNLTKNFLSLLFTLRIGGISIITWHTRHINGGGSMGDKSFGIDPNTIRQFALDIKEVVDLGVEVAVVVGGGNIFRGSRRQTPVLTGFQGTIWEC